MTQRPEVYGIDVDPETRCTHYHSERDIIAIKFKCCGRYYSCNQCHQALADHPAVPWSREEFDEKAILCGACGRELTIHEYMTCAYHCPYCGAAFNPRCERDYPLYFEVKEGSRGNADDF
jgi:uncharacterized CHY-type Zn-finger protein